MISFTCPYCGHGIRAERGRVDEWLAEHYDAYSPRRCGGRTYPR